MKPLLTLFIIFCLSTTAWTQNKLSFGLAIGAGPFHESVEGKDGVALSLPNIKLCHRVNEHWRMGLYIPGSLYKNSGKQRAFESFMFLGQYDVSKRFFVFGGIGLTQDAPAFYTVKDLKTAEFYSGFPSTSLGLGYAFWSKGGKRLELQYRFFYGTSNLPSTTRRAISNTLLLGLSFGD